MNKDTFTCVRVEGSILPVDLLQRVAANDSRLEGLRKEDYGLDDEKLNEATNHAWNRLSAAWDHFKAIRDTLPPTDSGYKLTLDKWLLPFWKVLGYGTLDRVTTPFVIDEKTYPVSHTRHHSPFHLVSFRHELDQRVEMDGKQFSPHGLVQELLNRSDSHLWGFVSNGLKLRILRDNIRLTRQAFVEFDLQAMFDGKQYADFALLWRLCHESRVTGEKPEQCWLERWSKVAAEQGLRALDQLRTGVENSVKALGRGYLSCPANADLKDALRHKRLTPLEYYRQLLRMVYRFLFVFVAEDRELLCDPTATDEAKERYTKYYSSARLRRLAERLRGTPHTDLYEGFALVLDKLGSKGCPELALPVLGGLFDPTRTPHLTNCRLANSDFLEAIRALSVITDGNTRRSVDYRNLGAEELGSVYESLLELQPRFDPEAITFTLDSASGNERKTTGSYYTPTSLITCLLDSALDPVLAEAAAKPNAEEAILALKVCDPACGSGHFLIAAAHRLAKKLASVRTYEEEPAPEAIRHALRDVIGRCIYGVDINPMAVELCQVALWMEALEPGKPLSFLEHHIQCGNSLLGTTPALLAKGIPDEAFEPIEGDDPPRCRELKRLNKQQRTDRTQGQSSIPYDEVSGLQTPSTLEQIDQLPDQTPEQIAVKATLFRDYQAEGNYRTSGQFLADAWCAAFVIPKRTNYRTVITDQEYWRLSSDPDAANLEEYAIIRRLADQYQFFHWHLAFKPVMARGGFDVVLGNPPWERIKLQEQEWFAAHGRPEIAGARTAAIRGKLIKELATSDPALYQAFLDDRRKAEGESHLVRDSSGIDEDTGERCGMFPLCGRGDVNTYSLFAELNRNLINPTGRVGCIVPSGIATDDTTKVFFQDLIERKDLVSIFHFENEEMIFSGVHHAYRFVLLTIGQCSQPEFVFYARRVEHIHESHRQFTLTSSDFRLLSPNTLTCSTFRSKRDAELTKGVYRRVPVLMKEGAQDGNPWSVRFMAMLHMANDSGLFRTATDLVADGWTLDGNVFRYGDEEYLPLYEAKLLHQFDHRWATYEGTDSRDVTTEGKTNPQYVAMPRYWVPTGEVANRLKDRWPRLWLLGWRDITGAEKVRTTIASILPRVGTGDTVLLMFPSEADGPLAAALIACLDSFVLDYASRQKLGGTHMKYHVFKQLPVLPPTTYAQRCPWNQSQTLAEWIKPRVLELTYTAYDLKPFAEDLGYDGEPFIWNDDRRAMIRAELDAAFFHLYGINKEDTAYILETFPIVKQKDIDRYGIYRTKEMILDCYERMATGEFESDLEIEPGKHVPTDLYGDPIQRPRRERIIQAFAATRRDESGIWSSEYVVCSDPHRKRYVDLAATTIPRITEEEACRELWNARRTGQLSGLTKSTEYHPPKGLRHYEFVIEWAYRHIINQLVSEGQPKKNTTLERILCTPDWRSRFDDLIGKLMEPTSAYHNFEPKDYRMVAMTIRKSTGGKQATANVFDQPIPIAQAEKQLPSEPGLYLIRSDADPVFTGWTDNLRHQYAYMQEAGKGSLVPTWLLNGKPAKTIAFQTFEHETPEKELLDYWRANLRKERPLLNLFEEEAG